MKTETHKKPMEQTLDLRTPEADPFLKKPEEPKAPVRVLSNEEADAILAQRRTKREAA